MMNFTEEAIKNLTEEAMTKLGPMFQNKGPVLSRADSGETHEDKSQPNENQVVIMADKGLQPVDGARVASSMEEKMTFARAKALLSEATLSTANSFIGLLQNQTTSADTLRETLEEVIEYRAADAVLTRAAEESALRTICKDAHSAAKKLVSLS